jgi:hypothetical protein
MFGIEINLMRHIVYIFIFIGFLGCATTKEYKLYRRDKSINYPKEKLTLKLISDTTGLFINADEGRETFNQKFIFARSNNDEYLIIEDVTPVSKNLISIKQGDTLVVHKNRMHFFYTGDKKYLLSFKRK